MALDMWFRDEVTSILACVHEAFSSTAVQARENGRGLGEDYERGFEDALRAVAMGFRIDIDPRRNTGQKLYFDGSTRLTPQPLQLLSGRDR